MTETHIHAPLVTEAEPIGELCIRTLAMPADTNANGDIFGGWLLGQMDLGGGVFASKIAKSRTVKSERYPPCPGEEVKNPWFFATRDPTELAP